MGGRFGKYGDLKRRQALQRGRREKFKLERANLIALRSRNGLAPPKQRSSLPFADRLKTVLQERPNIAGARNAGISQAAGELVVFIDDDAAPEPGRAGR